VAYWGPAHGPIETPVYQREALPVDAALDGPALVESDDTVCVVPPGWRFHLDGNGIGWLGRSGG
jgi:N-methylhydantoinase A